MPDIRNKETCDVLADSYVKNGFNKAQAMIEAGFSHSYAYSGKGQDIYKKVQVKSAITACMAKVRAESKDKADYIRGLHEAGVQLSLEKGDLVNYTRNVEGLGRSYAIYTDKYQDNSKDVPEPLSKEALTALQAMARTITEQELDAGPETIKLHVAERGPARAVEGRSQ